MNCKQVRALFSPRVDNELDPSLARRVEHHLQVCTDCTARWSSYETTVRMVRTLPQLAPDPSFVGQVLDRVRAYEAALREERPGLGTRLSQGLNRFDWGRLLFPARLSGALAFGVLVGFVLVWAGVMPGFSGPHQAGTMTAQSTQAATAPGTATSASPEAGPDRPFADLRAELSLVRAAGQADSSGQRASDGNPQPPEFRPGDLPSGTQQVKLSGSSGLPKITF